MPPSAASSSIWRTPARHGSSHPSSSSTSASPSPPPPPPALASLHRKRRSSPHRWLSKSRPLVPGHRRLAELQSESEALEDFPTASSESISRQPPLIPNATRRLRCMFNDNLMQVDVRGDLLAVPSGFQIHCWSAQEDAPRAFRGGPGGEITALAFSSTGRYVWAGTSKGYLFEVDMATLKMSSLREDAHHEAITMIARSHNNKILSLDKKGHLVVWLPNPDDGSLSSLRGPARADAIAAEPIWTQDLQGVLYAFYLQDRKSVVTLCELHVYDLETGKLLFDRGWRIDRRNAEALGSVSSVAIVPAHPDLVFLGHLSGHISAWERTTFKLVYSKKIGTEGVTTLLGPSRFLWVGFESGLIEVMDITLKTWRLLMRWQAHKGAILKLFLDTKSLWSASSIRVVSTGEDDTIRFWDGLLGNDWKQSMISQREKEFSTYSSLRVNMFTMNVGAAGPRRLTKSLNADNQNLLHDFLLSLKNPDVIVFGFQEVIDLSDVGLAAQNVLFASDSHDVTPKYHHWQVALTIAVRQHLGDGFVLVKDAKLVGLYSCVFAQSALRPHMKDLSVSLVKTGLLDNSYGNKGSILTRFSIDDSSLCFLNCHLAAGEEEAEKRAKDIIEILNARFPPPSASTRRAYTTRGDGTSVMDHELVFFAGDLNFRLTLPRKTVLQAVKDGEIDQLLPYDELRIEMNYNASFRLHNFEESAISFPPTYKYNTGTAIYDTSEKKRVPSWCDRILYRSEAKDAIKALSYRRYEADISDHRPVSAAFDCKIRKIDLIAHERVYRAVLRDWSAVESRLLEECRDRYGGGDD